jgi:hypothetical protein
MCKFRIHFVCALFIVVSNILFSDPLPVAHARAGQDSIKNTNSLLLADGNGAIDEVLLQYVGLASDALLLTYKSFLEALPVYTIVNIACENESDARFLREQIISIG